MVPSLTFVTPCTDSPCSRRMAPCPNLDQTELADRGVSVMPPAALTVRYPRPSPRRMRPAYRGSSSGRVRDTGQLDRADQVLFPPVFRSAPVPVPPTPWAGRSRTGPADSPVTIVGVGAANLRVVGDADRRPIVHPRRLLVGSTGPRPGRSGPRRSRDDLLLARSSWCCRWTG